MNLTQLVLSKTQWEINMGNKETKMPRKICIHSGCNTIIPYTEKFCEEHKKFYQEDKALKNKRYDNKIRHGKDKQYTEFYHSTEWEVLRNYIFNIYKGLDLFAYFIENKIVPASTGHHIVEIKENWGKRLEVDNIFPVSDASHKKIHLLYKKDKAGTQKLLRNLLQKWDSMQGRGHKKVMNNF